MAKAKVREFFKVRSIELLGHNRSGRRWHYEWTDVPASEVTKEMRDDPRLRIEAVQEVDSE